MALAAVIVSGVFAQNNWISFEQKGPGAGLRYEYVITPRFTLSAYFSYTYIIIPILEEQENSIEAGATVRWYPFARRFFTEVSFGYNIFEYFKREYDVYRNGAIYSHYDFRKDGDGFCIAPGFGWTIDIGKMGGFFLSPGVKFPITLADQFNITIAPYLGLGVAF
ncbi:MAG: hypothetical protein LBN21_07640 [Treponema sp.]|nr:hypothetical protein [Treponema sp.]